MDAHFELVDFGAIEPAVRRHLAELPGTPDSYIEDHLRASVHYRINVAGEAAGFASIHEERLITQFVLSGRCQRYGQTIFRQVRRLEQARSAFVPTFDEYFLSHALDDYRQVTMQGYFFALPDGFSPSVVPPEMALRLALADDIAVIREESGDLFDDVEKRISRRELFVTMRGGDAVGFGIMERSALSDDVASIGMFTRPRHRREGIGTATIALLIDACRRQGLRPLAGCWYYNHRSKRTLERAGMVTATRLLKIDY